MHALDRLASVLPEGAICIAFSGGMDSAVLAASAQRLGRSVRLLHLQTFLQTSRERRMASAMAEHLGLVCEEVPIDLVGAQFLTHHQPERCYHCKRLMMRTLLEHTHGTPLLEGTLADDDLDSRPGFRAIQELGIHSPWLACGVGKADVRALAIEWGLPVATLQPSACLATRVPFGTAVTPEVVRAIDQAEEALLQTGRFADVRLRLEVRGTK